MVLWFLYPLTLMALKGRDGQRCSHAPQPMQRCSFIEGILRDLRSL